MQHGEEVIDIDTLRDRALPLTSNFGFLTSELQKQSQATDAVLSDFSLQLLSHDTAGHGTLGWTNTDVVRSD